MNNDEIFSLLIAGFAFGFWFGCMFGKWGESRYWISKAYVPMKAARSRRLFNVTVDTDFRDARYQNEQN